jgi:hypothetical protein
MKTFTLRAMTTTAPIDRSDPGLSRKPRRTLGQRGTLIICLVTAGISLVSNVGRAYTDQVCDRHFADTNPATHDPKTEERVKLFAIRLLFGEIRFAADWNSFQQELRKGSGVPVSAPDLPDADLRQLDAAIDLHCYAPLEVRLSRTADGGVDLDIDNWRSYVNSTVTLVQTQKDDTIKQAEDLINKVRREDRAIAAADFNRDCLLSRTPYEARVDPNDVITIVEVKSSQPPSPAGQTKK